MVIYLSPLVAIVGLLMYALCEKPKTLKIAEIMFFCGLLATLLQGPKLLP